MWELNEKLMCIVDEHELRYLTEPLKFALSEIVMVVDITVQ